jgi:AcrR family transcriptional regulator
MTEAEWLTTTDPRPMLDFLRPRASNRKLRLFACGCGRQLWSRLDDERSRRSVEVAERFADGLATADELESAWVESYLANSHSPPQSDPDVRAASTAATAAAARSFGRVFGAAFQAGECLSGVLDVGGDLLRDIFGNLFRPAALHWSWLTPSVLDLAREIYAGRAFDRLSVLADALQDAGCDHPDVLSHCRDDGSHIRGCWVVDLVLGKT